MSEQVPANDPTMSKGGESERSEDRNNGEAHPSSILQATQSAGSSIAAVLVLYQPNSFRIQFNLSQIARFPSVSAPFIDLFRRGGVAMEERRFIFPGLSSDEDHQVLRSFRRRTLRSFMHPTRPSASPIVLILNLDDGNEPSGWHMGHNLLSTDDSLPAEPDNSQALVGYQPSPRFVGYRTASDPFWSSEATPFGNAVVDEFDCVNQNLSRDMANTLEVTNHSFSWVFARDSPLFALMANSSVSQSSSIPQ
ncbi:hypothetical protein BDZ45DRAFT_804696 [Acephala macrosclerotiorum]|nr:hypothetical protein BDZ45DRAFT_804696 [Acephala macrosclerotiorum]